MVRRRLLIKSDLEAPSSTFTVAPIPPFSLSSDGRNPGSHRKRKVPISVRKGPGFLYVPIVGITCIALWLFGTHFFSKDDAWMVLPEVQVLMENKAISVNGAFVVFVSRSNRKETLIHMGRSMTSPSDALRQAVQTTRGLTTKSHPWVKIDVVHATETIEHFDFSAALQSQVKKERTWFFGLSLDWDSGWSFLPEEVWSQNMIDGKTDVLRWDNLFSYVIEKRQLKHKNIEGWTPILEQSIESSVLKDGLHLFYTSSLFIDFSNPKGEEKVTSVFHGHRIFEKDVSSNVLMDAAQAAGAYLTRSVKEVGKMVYIYNPRTDEESDSYNLTRHAGTLYAMACLYRHSKDPRLLDSMRIALDWLLKNHLEQCRLPFSLGDSATQRCITESKADKSGQQQTRFARLGVNALTLLAIAEFIGATNELSSSLYTEYQFYVDVANDLAEYIQGAQRDDGSFVQKVQIYPKFELDETFFVRYYQGEATFALSRFYHVTGLVGLEKKDEWLDVAEAAAKYIVDKNWDVRDEEFVDDHWLMYGFAELHRCGRRLDQRCVDFIMRTVQLVSKSQFKENSKTDKNLSLLDWVGIHHESTSATSTATKSEGLCAVYDLALHYSHPDEAQQIIDTVLDSVRYQLKAQFRPELAIYMRDPERILGGMRKGIDSLMMRNDYTQHNLSSFLCLAKLLQNK